MVWILVEHEASLRDNLGMAQFGVDCSGAVNVRSDFGALVAKMLAKGPFATDDPFHLRRGPLYSENDLSSHTPSQLVIDMESAKIRSRDLLHLLCPPTCALHCRCGQGLAVSFRHFTLTAGCFRDEWQGSCSGD